MPVTRNQLLSAEFLAQLERLSVLSRRPVRGWTAGQRRSRQAGHSVEFHDYRPYVAGDDLRYLDWNILRRTDRMMLKLFVDDEELNLHLLLDASASMDWGEPSKLLWATRMAAALGFIGLSSLERVGLGVMRERVTEGWRPSRGRAHIPALLDHLAAIKGRGITQLNDSLTQYAAQSRSSGLLVLVSDLMDPAGYESGLRALLERRFEVHLIHVLSPQELEPRLEGDLRLIDKETGATRLLRVKEQTLRAYQQRLRVFLDDAQTFCQDHGIGYHRTSTGTAVESFVLGALRGRLLA